jgi:hypothetical protein
MAGVASASLQGWSIQMTTPPWQDHTYVTSSCGLVWQCWGGCSGGTALSAALGSSIVADCLSQPNSQAGIVYGITGVCHQTSNRILHSARVTVVGCQGYNLSVFAYGVYGAGNWPQLSVCYPHGTVPAQPGSTRAASPGRNLSSMTELYNSSVSEARMTAVTEEATRLTELSALVEMALGHPLDQETFRALSSIQTALWNLRTALTTRLNNGELTPNQYLVQLDASLRSAMEQSRVLLGDERFKMIFGEAGEHPERLINATTFMEQTIADA